MKWGKLTDMPNIGKVLAGNLAAVGIDTPEKLIEAGSENAFIRIRALDPGACVCKLNALEGAVQGVRWHDLDNAKKNELKILYKSLK